MYRASKRYSGTALTFSSTGIACQTKTTSCRSYLDQKICMGKLSLLRWWQGEAGDLWTLENRRPAQGSRVAVGIRISPLEDLDAVEVDLQKMLRV
jgi:hypothetical protein